MSSQQFGTTLNNASASHLGDVCGITLVLGEYRAKAPGFLKTFATLRGAIAALKKLGYTAFGQKV